MVKINQFYSMTDFERSDFLIVTLSGDNFNEDYTSCIGTKQAWEPQTKLTAEIMPAARNQMSENEACLYKNYGLQLCIF